MQVLNLVILTIWLLIAIKWGWCCELNIVLLFFIASFDKDRPNFLVENTDKYTYGKIQNLFSNLVIYDRIWPEFSIDRVHFGHWTNYTESRAII